MLTKQKELMLKGEAEAARPRWYFAIFASIALALVFLAPYYFPMQVSPSFSYHFGYNNRVGIILLVLFLAAGSILTRGMGIRFSLAGDSQPAPAKLLILALLAVSLGCAGMFAFAGRFGGFGESFYNVDRVWLMLHGKAPYVDFEWVYGVYFLYVPLFFCQVLGLSVISATYLAWALSFMVGIGLLFFVVNLVNYPTTKKPAIFLLLVGAMYPYILSMGPDPIVRHVGPLFLVLLVQRLFNGGGIRSKVYAALVGAICVGILVLLISPETGVTFTFACICVFLLDIRRNAASSLGLSLTLLVAFASFFGLANRLHILDTMMGFAVGAFNLPIIPAPHILLYFSALFLCACFVYWRLANGAKQDNTICLIAYSVPAITAALGHCDAPHVFLNGIGIFLAGLFYVSNYSRAWRWSRVAFLAFIVVLPTIAGLWFYIPNLASVFLNTLEEGGHSRLVMGSINLAQRHILPHFKPETRQKFEARLEKARQLSAKPDSKNLADLYPEWQGEFSAPFCYRPNHLGSDLTTRVDYGYYEGLENVYVAADVRRKIHELENQPQRALLLQEDFDTTCQVNPTAEKHVISFLFFFPYSAKAIHTDSVYGPLCDYIHAHYTKEREAPVKDGYGLWIRKASEGPTAQLSADRSGLLN